MKTKTKTKMTKVSNRATAILILKRAERALLRLAVDEANEEASNHIADAHDRLCETLANLRKPLQPTPHTHGPLPFERKV
jgi:hypothetical protein